MEKIPVILDHKEKRALIETLLIIAGIFTAFNKDIVSTFPILIIFIIASLIYIIRNTAVEKNILMKIRDFNFPVSMAVASGFSGLLVVIGTPAFVSYGLLIGIPLEFILFGTLLILLLFILYVE